MVPNPSRLAPCRSERSATTPSEENQPMSVSPATLPPVLLHSEAELARAALATPLLSRAVRLARWAGPETRVGAGGELVDAQLPAASAELDLAAAGIEEADAAAYTSEAWRVAVDTGLVDV